MSGFTHPPQLARSYSASKLTLLPTFVGDAATTPAMAVARNTEHVLRMQHLVLVMVGLPARGKSYITHKLRRYMNWMGFTVRALQCCCTASL